MPPVGQKVICGSGPPIDFIIDTPPAASAGKNFKWVKPCTYKFIASVGVATPANNGTVELFAASMSAGVVPGLTKNVEPALIAFSKSAGVIIVPAPITASSGSASTIAVIASSAQGVRKVIS